MTSEHFEKEMRTHNEEMTKTERTVDTCKVHPKTKVLKSIQLIFLPTNCTCVLTCRGPFE